MKKRVVIIGGGAAGMTAAVFAARGGAQVTLLEHKDRVGKKILSTGNGKCNLSNRRMEAACYRCGRPEFPMEIIGQFPVKDTLAWFEAMGIVIRDRDGYLYPRSGQASSVLDGLRAELAAARIRVVTECEVRRIFTGKAGTETGKKETEKRENVNWERTGFLVETSKGTFPCEALIVAAGSRAAPGTGSDGSGYALARTLGHRVAKPLPALVQLRCRERFYRQVAGVRTEARVSLFCAKEKAKEQFLACDQGEVQLTDYGISGIPVFQVSRFASRALDQGKAVTAVLDFYPERSMEETVSFAKRRRTLLKDRKTEEFFTGWLPGKLGILLLKLAGVRHGEAIGELTDEVLARLISYVKTFRTEIEAANPFENAQVCCGGVDAEELTLSMESRLVKGLYFAGEIVDVDGICGGYNLQWAWSSGAVAGKSAAVTVHG